MLADKTYHRPGSILFRCSTLWSPNLLIYHSFVPTAVTARLVATKMVPQARVKFTMLPFGAAMMDKRA